jgi:hypothetical protein
MGSAFINVIVGIHEYDSILLPKSFLISHIAISNHTNHNGTDAVSFYAVATQNLLLIVTPVGFPTVWFAWQVGAKILV